MGIFCIYNIELERVDAEFSYEMDLLCSQSRMIVGSQHEAYIEKTLYVYCNDEIEDGRNFTRSPHVEKSWLKVNEIGRTQSPIARLKKDS